MKNHKQKRSLLVRVVDPDSAEPRRLRVQVTLYGLTAAVVEELAEMTGRARAVIVREWIDEAVRSRKVYEEPG